MQTDEKRIAGDSVERGKWFIEKKQAWSGRKCASQCHALRLAAGEILRATRGEVACADKIQHFVYAAGACGAVETAQAVGHIRGGGEVREERGLLRDQRSLAMAGWDARSDGGFGKRAAVKSDAAADRIIEAGEQAKQCAFARTRRAEDDGPIGGKSAFHMKVEAAAA